jgi:cephalosporin-C deacetylase
VPLFDLSPEELLTYRIATAEPDGLDQWWAQRVDKARSVAAPPRLDRHAPDAYGPTPVWDVEFSGSDGDRIRGWYLRPAGVAPDDPLPVVVTFIGYGGGRGVPTEHMVLPGAGFANLVMDTRGQGGRWTVGATGDRVPAGSGPEYPGVMTRGIGDPDTYYFSRLFTDAARAVDVAAELPGVDASRLAVAGGSQGGGLALAAAALSGDRVRVCQADVPFLCDLQRAVTITGGYPYAEIADFLAQHTDLVAQALDTLRYVDCALLARRITADCLLSVGLMDEICPPSTVYAAYHEIPSAKELAVFPFGVHATPGSHGERKLRHLRERLLPV